VLPVQEAWALHRLVPEATENKVEHKHRQKTDHKHRSRNNYKNKNKSERMPRKIGRHKKKMECAMVIGASDINSSSCYTSSSSSGEEEEVELEPWHDPLMLCGTSCLDFQACQVCCVVSSWHSKSC
jgi:hypothetical protein